jgi:hypothetical protein
MSTSQLDRCPAFQPVEPPGVYPQRQCNLTKGHRGPCEVEGQPSALRRGHRDAMEAKVLVFQAQDAIARVKLPKGATGTAASSGLRVAKSLRGRMERELAKARAALEAFDRAYEAALDHGGVR